MVNPMFSGRLYGSSRILYVIYVIVKKKRQLVFQCGYIPIFIMALGIENCPMLGYHQDDCIVIHKYLLKTYNKKY